MPHFIYNQEACFIVVTFNIAILTGWYHIDNFSIEANLTKSLILQFKFHLFTRFRQLYNYAR